MTFIHKPPDTLKSLIKGIQFAMLTTRDHNGILHSRPMVTQEEEGEDLWFFTESDTHKATDIVANPNINLSYSDPGSHRYVSVSGWAEIIDGRALMQKRWLPAYAEWMPLGLDGPKMTLLKVVVVRVDFWEMSSIWRGHTLGSSDGASNSEHYEGKHTS